MDWYSASFYGKELYEERLRDAQNARNILSAKKVSKLPALLKLLFLIFT